MPVKYQPIHCYAYRGEEKTIESSNFTVFNPTGDPGTAVFACSCAARASIGSQVACRLALEHFTTSLLDYYKTDAADSNDNSEALESAFREANRSVYTFGHSLAAGGRMAAAFLALVVKNGVFAAGRVGGGSAYLFREGELYSFFENTTVHAARAEDAFLGSRSLVAVDLANVPSEAGDKIFLFSEELDLDLENELKKLAADKVVTSSANPAEAVCRYLFATPAAIGFTGTVFLGPDALFLPGNLIMPS
jgi:hypothetical protein